MKAIFQPLPAWRPGVCRALIIWPWASSYCIQLKLRQKPEIPLTYYDRITARQRALPLSGRRLLTLSSPIAQTAQISRTQPSHHLERLQYIQSKAVAQAAIMLSNNTADRLGQQSLSLSPRLTGLFLQDLRGTRGKHHNADEYCNGISTREMVVEADRSHGEGYVPT